DSSSFSQTRFPGGLASPDSGDSRLNRMGFFTLTDILKKLTAQNPALKKRLEEAEALKAWEAAVGPQIAKHATATRVDNGVLYVEVDHSIWKTELHHRKTQILDRLNAGLGDRHVIQDLFLI